MENAERLVNVIEECVIDKTDKLFGKYINDGCVVDAIEHQGWGMINMYDNLDNIKVVKLRYIGMGHFKVMCQIVQVESNSSDEPKYITDRVGGYIKPTLEIQLEMDRFSKITEGTLSYNAAVQNMEELW